MRVRLFLVAAALVVVAIVAIRLAETSTYIAGYRVIDDYNIALQVVGANPTWRSVTVKTESASTVTVGISEISLRIGAGFDDTITYVVVRLDEPLGSRTVIDAASGVEISRLTQ